MDFKDEDVTMEVWRRKYLWFPVEIAEDGLGYPVPHWPPYYGSWSKTRQAARQKAEDQAIHSHLDRSRFSLVSRLLAFTS